jgi:hypothetical protein
MLNICHTEDTRTTLKNVLFISCVKISLSSRRVLLLRRDMEGSCKYNYHAVANSRQGVFLRWRRTNVNSVVNSSGPSIRNCPRRWRDEPLVDSGCGPATWLLVWKVPSDTTTWQCLATECPAWSSLRLRLHWSQNRHNTANQYFSGHT